MTTDGKGPGGHHGGDAGPLDEIDSSEATQGNRAFYCATPPSLFSAVAINLGKSGLSVGAGGGWWT